MDPQAPPFANDSDRLSCPVMLPTGRDARIVCERLEKQGMTGVPCQSMDELLRKIEAGCGPILIAEEALAPRQWQQLRETVVGEPSWSDLPILFFTRSKLAQTPPSDPLLARRATVLIARPVDESILYSLVRAGLDSRARQYQVRDLLRELQVTNRKLDRRVEQLQQLGRVLTRAEEKERRRIAQELHDGLQQLLAAGRVTLGRLRPPDSTEAVREQASAELDSIIKEAIQASRNLTQDLCPPLLYQGGLGPALDQLAGRLQSSQGLKVSVHYAKDMREVPEALRAFLFEAVRELLQTIQQQRATSTADVELEVKDDYVRLSVTDPDGEIADQKLGGEDAGQGLFEIRERTEGLGGKLQVGAAQQGGSCVALLLPVSLAAEREDAVAGQPVSCSSDSRAAAGTPASRGISVLVADDHRVMRSGLVTLLSDVPGISSVAEAGDGVEALTKARALHPDVAVVDVSMPNMNGIDLTQRLRAELSETRIIALSMFEEEDVARQMLNAGADAYLVKSGPAEDLVSSVLGRLPAGDQQEKERKSA